MRKAESLISGMICADATVVPPAALTGAFRYESERIHLIVLAQRPKDCLDLRRHRIDAVTLTPLNQSNFAVLEVDLRPGQRDDSLDAWRVRNVGRRRAPAARPPAVCLPLRLTAACISSTKIASMCARSVRISAPGELCSCGQDKTVLAERANVPQDALTGFDKLAIRGSQGNADMTSAARPEAVTRECRHTFVL